MKKVKQFLAIALLFITLPAMATPPNTWQIPAGSKAKFTIDGLMGLDVNGTLVFSNSAIVFDPAHPEQVSMKVTLSVSTLATGIGKRDKHLKSDDFFNVAKYPSITFTSSSVKKTSGNNYEVTGTLKVKESSKTVTIPFTFSQAGNTGSFKGKFTIDRTQYGIGTGKENGMGHEVKISLDVPVKQ